MRRLWLLGSLMLSLPSWAMASSTITFVGCKTEGAWQNFPAPIGKSIVVDLPSNIASSVALYAADGTAVLGPRGWSCIRRQGNHSSLFIVSPKPYPGFDIPIGPVIYVQENLNIFSQEYIAGTYFPGVFTFDQLYQDLCTSQACIGPSNKRELDTVLAERYPTDTIVYRTPRLLEYTSPAGHLGLGSESMPSRITTYGLLSLNETSHSRIIQLGVRLPSEMKTLRALIINSFERCLPIDSLGLCKDSGLISSIGENNPK